MIAGWIESGCLPWMKAPSSGEGTIVTASVAKTERPYEKRPGLRGVWVFLDGLPFVYSRGRIAPVKPL